MGKEWEKQENYFRATVITIATGSAHLQMLKLESTFIMKTPADTTLAKQFVVTYPVYTFDAHASLVHLPASTYM